jgi:6-phosphogluconolactonase (cycloisomerase 2 family)
MPTFLRWVLVTLLLLQSREAIAYDAVDIALEKQSSSYLFGRAGIDKFDCSGLTQFAYAHVGFALPRMAANQALLGTLVTTNVNDTASMRRGDLLFFADTKSDAQLGIVGHVGIYVGDGKMINSVWVGEGTDQEIKTVRVDDFTTNVGPTWWRSIFISARRLPPLPGASTKFSVGDVIEATENDVNIRGLSDSWSTVLGSGKTGRTTKGVRGSITSRPIYTPEGAGNWFWKVDFDSGDDGWVAEAFLTKEAANRAVYAYVVNRVSNTISSYALNPSSGALTPVGTATATGGTPFSVATHPGGKFAYVGNVSDIISAFSIDANTGALTPIGTVLTGSNPRSVTVDPLGKFAYVANLLSNNVSAYSINASTGMLTLVGTFATGAFPNSIVIHPTGRFAYVVHTLNTNTVTAYAINAGTGALTPIATMATGANPWSMTIDPTGRFGYVINQLSGDVSPYLINTATGTLAPNGAATAVGSNPRSAAIDPTGRFFYAANNDSFDIAAFSINASTGALTSIGARVPAGISPYSVTVDPSGKFAYAVSLGQNTVLSYAINSATGALTPNGTPAPTGAWPQAIAIVKVR